MTGGIVDVLEIQPYGKSTMMVSKTLTVTVTDAQGIKHKVTIPVGFVFDGASIPRLVWSLIGHPFDPSYVTAAAVHDWYCVQAVNQGDYELRVIGDAVFFALLQRAGVAQWKRSAMYVAVRMNAYAGKRKYFK